MRFVKLTGWHDGDAVYVVPEHVAGVTLVDRNTVALPPPEGAIGFYLQQYGPEPVPEGAPEYPTEVSMVGDDAYLVRESPGQVCELAEAALRPSALR